MSKHASAVFLRLEGPLQAWGTTSRYSIRATNDVPSKSGVIGLICSALGLRRSQVAGWLERLNRLKMGVRVDRPGRMLMDYHTSGAKIGLMSAQGKIKITQTTGEIEPQVSRCYYLADASFLLALRGPEKTIRDVADALQNPVWPPFLGRKSCPPAIPVYAGLNHYAGLAEALASQEWLPRTPEDLGLDNTQKTQLDSYLETDSLNQSAFPVADVPLSFLPPTYGFRCVTRTTISAPCGSVRQPHIPDWHPHTEPHSARWKAKRLDRLEKDRYLCVFCKAEADHIHHVTYKNAPFEEIHDLRSVCELCHSALTMIEYSQGRTEERLDPLDVKNRPRIIKARELILKDSIPYRIRRRGD